MKKHLFTAVCALLALTMLPGGASAKAKGVENIIVEIADVIEQVTDQRIKKKQAKIKRATSKYHK